MKAGTGQRTKSPPSQPKQKHFQQLDAEILLQQNTNLLQRIKRLEQSQLSGSGNGSDTENNGPTSLRQPGMAALQAVLESVLVTVLDVGARRSQVEVEESEMVHRKERLLRLVSDLSVSKEGGETRGQRVRALMGGVVGLVNWIERGAIGKRRRKTLHGWFINICRLGDPGDLGFG